MLMPGLRLSDLNKKLLTYLLTYIGSHVCNDEVGGGHGGAWWSPRRLCHSDDDHRSQRLLLTTPVVFC